MEKPTGKDVRNFTKDKVLMFLSLIREKGGSEAVFGAVEIAKRTDTKYSSIKTLLHRWSQKPFLYRIPHGKVIKRNGFGLVEEVDESRWHLAYKWGYKISPKGLSYLVWAQIHQDSDFYQLAEDTVTRLSSDRIYWFDHVNHGMFFIHLPFCDPLDFGQVDLSTIPKNFNHPLDGNNWWLAKDGMEQAFEAALVGFHRPPTEAFRQYVFNTIERINREYRREHPPFPTIPLPPIVQKGNDVNQYGIPKFLHINEKNLDAAEKELEQLRKHPPDKQEPQP
jgi:hypothetical protein